MHFLLIGFSHKSTPLYLREKLALTPHKVSALLDITQPPNTTNNFVANLIHECVILSTCNRLEIYAVVDSPALSHEKIICLISQIQQISIEAIRPHSYCLRDEQVVEHLMRVAAGLDSMVLGEPQILGQLTSAYKTALAHNSAKANLSRLFQVAIHAGKRVRTETAIGQNPASVSSVAVRLTQRHLGDLAERTVVILGAGEMGTLTLQTLIKQSVGKIIILSRSWESAEQVATRWQCLAQSPTQITPLPLTELPHILPQADAIITSTAARQPILKRDAVAASMALRPERPLLIVDIALPRDVETAVGDLPAVHLYNLDDLQSQVAESLQKRRQEIPQAEMIIAAESERFWEWHRSRAVIPTITHFRSRFETIKERELSRTLNCMSHLDQRDKERVAELAHRLVNKFLHHPTVHLKTEAARGHGNESTEIIHQLFGLEKERSS